MAKYFLLFASLIIVASCGQSKIDRDYHAGYSCTNSPSGLLAWWDGDSVSGTSVADLAGANDGTEQNTVASTSGKVGNAFSFDGTGGYVNVPNSDSLSNLSAVTVSAWVKGSAGSRAVRPQIIAAKWKSKPTISSTDFDATTLTTVDGISALGLTTSGFDGRYTYSGPGTTGGVSNGRVVRYDTRSSLYSTSSYAGYDASSTGGLDTTGYQGTVFDGRYLYYVPWIDSSGVAHSKFLRYDTQGSFTSSGSWTAFNGSAVGLTGMGYHSGIFDGRYVYYAPVASWSGSWGDNGKVVRFDTTASFTSSSSWTVYDASTTDGLHTVGFRGSTFDGRYIYFSPALDNSDSGNGHGRVLRYDTQATFGSSGSWSAYDAGNTSGLPTKGFANAEFDGRYVYFSPYLNPSSHGNFLRYDTQGGFKSAASWTGIDLSSVSSPISSDLVFDGQYLLFGVNPTAVRYDVQRAFGTLANYESVTASYGMGLGSFDGRYFYGGTSSGIFGRYDAVGTTGSFQLAYTAVQPTRTGGTRAYGARFLVNTQNGAGSVDQSSASLSSMDWHHIVGTYEGTTLNLYLDGTLDATRSFAGTLISNSTNLSIGGLSDLNGTFNGSIDELQIYNRALTSTEVQSIYSQGSSGLCKIAKTSFLRQMKSNLLATMGGFFHSLYRMITGHQL